MLLRLSLAYDGTAFRGWADQPGQRTVEGALGAALDAIYGERGRIAVAGRTDTGVHALAQVASVEVAAGPPAERARIALDARLPEDVALLDVRAAPPDFHARHSARARAYIYRVRLGQVRDPLAARRELFHPRRVDRAVLDRCAAQLVGTHDFTAFTPTETQHRTFRRTITHAAWWQEGDDLRFTVAADAFLRHQVRTMVGTMLQMARGERDPDRLPALLAGASRDDAGLTAPAWGLYLAGVRYDGEEPGRELAGIRQLLARGPQLR